MPKSHGIRRKTRHILHKDFVRGLSYLLYDYKVGNKVVINIDPSEHKGMPHKRFQGKVGIISKVGRRTLTAKVNVGNKEKIVTARLNHVKQVV
ncbi:MAG: 50S ribosomal protein L21 [Thaumarchaeota archaeon]|nr:50S ribosomal protein L21 [Nitrososphaerota archaeon]